MLLIGLLLALSFPSWSQLYFNDFNIKINASNGKTYDLIDEYKGGYKIILKYVDGMEKVFTHKEFVELGMIEIEPCDQLEYIRIQLNSEDLSNFNPSPGHQRNCETLQLFGPRFSFSTNAEYLDHGKFLTGFEPLESSLIVANNPSDVFNSFAKEIKEELGLTLLNLKIYEAPVKKFAESIAIKDEGETHRIEAILFYDETFFESLQHEENQVSLKMVMLHEIGHIILHHGSGRKSELDADQFMGQWMRRYFEEVPLSDLNQAFENLLDAYHPTADYPTKEERFLRLNQGWQEENQAIIARNNSQDHAIHEQIDRIELTALNEVQEAINQLNVLYNQQLSDSLRLRVVRLLSEYYAQEYFNTHSFYSLATARLTDYSLLAPEDPRPLYLRGLINYIESQGKGISLITDFQELLHMDLNRETEAEVRFYLGSIHFKAQRYTEALNELEVSINLDKTNSLAYYRKAVSKYELGIRSWNALLDDLDRALELEALQTTHKDRMDNYQSTYSDFLKEAISQRLINANYTDVINLYNRYKINNAEPDNDVYIKAAKAYFHTHEYKLAQELYFKHSTSYPVEFFFTMDSLKNYELAFSAYDNLSSTLNEAQFELFGEYFLKSSGNSKYCECYKRLIENRNYVNFFGSNTFILDLIEFYNANKSWFRKRIEDPNEFTGLLYDRPEVITNTICTN